MELLIPQHPLFVVQDLVSLKSLCDGYLLVYEGGLTLNHQKYDVPVLHSTQPVELPDFYHAPIRSCPQEENGLYALVQKLRSEGYSRQLVRFPGLAFPCLYDAVCLDGEEIGLSSHAYTITTVAELKAQGETGKKAIDQLDRLASLCEEQVQEATLFALNSPEYN